jgi:hypothetical protein
MLDYVSFLEKHNDFLARVYVEKSRWQALKGRCWSAPVLANGVLYLRHESKLVAVEAGQRHAGK